MDNVDNVVLVVVDALRADRVYSEEYDLTPNIDRIAAESLVFKNCFSCTNTTDPSITSIHTGRYPSSTVYHHGKYVTMDEKQRVESVDTLPEILRDEGLKTVAAGRGLARWHSRGFDSYPEPRGESWVKTDRTGSDTGSDYERSRLKLAYIDFVRFIDRQFSDKGVSRMVARRLYRTLTRTTNFDQITYELYSEDIQSFANELNKTPFYGFLHLMDTHTPYTELPMTTNRQFLKQYREFDNPMHALGVSKYDSSVKRADKQVGTLISELKSQN